MPISPLIRVTAATVATLLFLTSPSPVDAQPVGVFENQGDVGLTKRAGSASFAVGPDAYTVTGGGANMWFTNDAFHFVWKQVAGDATLAADISFPDEGGDPHRKACLLVRQSLAPDSAYADAAVHGTA